MASIIKVSSTSESITVKVSGLDANYNGEAREIYWYANGSYYGKSSLPNMVSLSNSFEYDGLSPNTSYSMEAKVYLNSVVLATVYGTHSTDSSSSRPSNFSWTQPKVAGGSMNLTANEWSLFQDKINSFRNYKNLSDYSFTTVFTGGTVYATIYNQARTAIQGISGYGTYIPLAVSGEQVLAYHMNQIVAELNAIP